MCTFSMPKAQIILLKRKTRTCRLKPNSLQLQTQSYKTCPKAWLIVAPLCSRDSAPHSKTLKIIRRTKSQQLCYCSGFKGALAAPEGHCCAANKCLGRMGQSCVLGKYSPRCWAWPQPKLCYQLTVLARLCSFPLGEGLSNCYYSLAVTGMWALDTDLAQIWSVNAPSMQFFTRTRKHAVLLLLISKILCQ